jgi:hypothetical protein
MAYEMRGQFLEACDCQVMCPCWLDQEPDEDQCTGMIAWYVERGRIDTVDVSGLAAVSVSYHRGHRHGAKARVALLVDDRASDAQQQALAGAFTGKLGGPLAELAEMTDETGSVQPARISYTTDAAATTVTAGQVLTVTMSPLTGSTGRITTLADAALATLLGTPAEVGRSSAFRLDLPGQSLDLDVQARGANRGRFAYRCPDPAAAASR